MELPKDTKLGNWRSMMAWMYFSVCICDFIIFPILWTSTQVLYGGKVVIPWSPMTLQGAGFFHVAMGAILGVSVWQKSEEKKQIMRYTDIENERVLKKVPNQENEEL